MRVVPRDLFNESKLLKCLGRIAVDILDGKFAKYGLHDLLEDDYDGFQIEQTDDGDITCTNYKVMIPTAAQEEAELSLYSRLNGRDNYPMFCVTHEEEIIEVFNDDGSYTEEFYDYLELMNKFEGEEADEEE